MRRVKRRKPNEMKRSQTSHDLLIRGLNTADVFCRCNIIIFSMRTQEAGLNKPCNLWSMEAPAESTKSNKFHWSSCLPDCASYICQSIRLLLQRALLSSHICSVPIERSRGSYYILRGIYRSISLLLQENIKTILVDFYSFSAKQKYILSTCAAELAKSIKMTNLKILFLKLFKKYIGRRFLKN